MDDMTRTIWIVFLFGSFIFFSIMLIINGHELGNSWPTIVSIVFSGYFLYTGIGGFLRFQKIKNLLPTNIGLVQPGQNLICISGKTKYLDKPLLSPISKEKCIWWRVEAQASIGTKSYYFFSSDSSELFNVYDDTGEITIDYRENEPVAFKYLHPSAERSAKHIYRGNIKEKTQQGGITEAVNKFFKEGKSRPLAPESLEFINNLDEKTRQTFIDYGRQYEEIRIYEYYVVEGEPAFAAGEIDLGTKTLKIGNSGILNIGDKTKEEAITETFGDIIDVTLIPILVPALLVIFFALSLLKIDVWYIPLLAVPAIIIIYFGIIVFRPSSPSTH